MIARVPRLILEQVGEKELEASRRPLQPGQIHSSHGEQKQEHGRHEEEKVYHDVVRVIRCQAWHGGGYDAAGSPGRQVERGSEAAVAEAGGRPAVVVVSATRGGGRGRRRCS